MNGYQIFVLADDARRVSGIIDAYVKRVGAAAQMSPTSDKPSPSMAKRARRTFVISTPENGYITIWEDGIWADKRLAAQVSEELRSEAIWLMVSGATDSWAYIKYRNGKQVDKHMGATDAYLAEARKFAKTNRLPFALFFFEDPNAEDEFEKFLATMKAEKGHDPFFDEIDPPPKKKAKAASLKALPSGSPVPKALRGKIEKFLELTVPTAS